VRVQGLELRVDFAGAGAHARPLLLIGGIGANIEMWRPLRALLGGLPTLAYDAAWRRRPSRPELPVRARLKDPYP
jgi:poly(3-hydroxyoctanoate) depolymerase